MTNGGIHIPVVHHNLLEWKGKTMKDVEKLRTVLTRVLKDTPFINKELLLSFHCTQNTLSQKHVIHSIIFFFFLFVQCYCEVR